MINGVKGLYFLPCMTRMQTCLMCWSLGSLPCKERDDLIDFTTVSETFTSKLCSTVINWRGRRWCTVLSLQVEDHGLKPTNVCCILHILQQHRCYTRAGILQTRVHLLQWCQRASEPGASGDSVSALKSLVGAKHFEFPNKTTFLGHLAPVFWLILCCWKEKIRV